MKKVIYVVLIICFFGFLLKTCIKKDKGYDTIEADNYPPLEVIEYNLPQRYTLTKNGVDYLVSTSPVGKFGGDLITSSIGEGPKTFNPYVANDSTSAAMGELMYDGLLTTNSFNGNLEPKLAKRFEVLDNKLSYILELRHGVKWSDGKEITADDVVYTYNTIVFGGYGNTSVRDALYVNGKLPKVEKLDKYTVKFTTPVPFAPFARNLTLPIAPKHVFKKATDKGKNYFNSFLGTVTDPKDFVTSGAFKLKEYTPAQRVVFERNPNYYVINKDGQKLPYLDKWIVLIVGDLNNEAIKFEGGEIDLVTLQGSMVSRYREKEAKSDYKLYNIGATTSTTFLSINLNTRKDPKGKFYVEPKKQLWFNDVNFRSAIDYAVDRDNLVLNILYGIGQPLFGAESPSSLFLNEDIAKGHLRDLKKAKELLKKSGFVLKNGDLYDKFGNRVEFELATNAGNTQREASGVSIKEDLAQLGMKVNFKPIDFNTLVNRLSNDPNYDMVIISLTSNPFEPHTGNNVWTSRGVLHMFNQRFENDKDKPLAFEQELDKIYEEGAQELDFEKRKKIYDRYQEIVYEEKPFIFLYSPINIVAVRKKLSNIYPTQLGGAIHNIDEIYINK